MPKIIINADDFGYCDSVNRAIIDAHNNGVVTSCTIMAGMPGFEEGVRLLKENPTLGSGVHMTLTCYKPVLEGHKTIVDEKGYFHRRLNEEIINNIDKEEVYEEFCAQIEKVISRGVKISHLDSHHHIHTSEMLKDVVKRITDKYKLPIRGGFRYETDLNVDIIPVLGSFYKDNVSADYFKNIDLETIEVADMMCHPGFSSDFLKDSTSYASEREYEHKILTSDEFKNSLDELGITLTNYVELNNK